MKSRLIHLILLVMGFVVIYGCLCCTTPIPTTPPSWFTERQQPSHKASVNEEPPAFPMTLKWQVALEGPMYSSPVIQLDQGNLYIGSDAHKFWALNPATGEIRWIFESEGNLRGSAAAINVMNNTGGITEMLFVTSSEGNLYSLNPSSGQENWRVEGAGPFVSSPNYSDGKIFYLHQAGGASSVLRAVDAFTGEVLWESRSTNISTASPSVGPGSLYIGTRGQGLLSFWAVDPNTGQIRDELLGGLMSTGIYTSGAPDYDRPIYNEECTRIGDRVYISARKGVINSFEINYDAENAVSEWETSLEIQEDITGFALTTGRGASNVLVASHPGGLCALDSYTGAAQWHYTFPPRSELDQRTRQPAIWGNFVFHTHGADLEALSLSDGTVQWSYELEDGTYGSPAIAGGCLYIADANGTVYAFSGEPREEVTAPRPRPLNMWIASGPGVKLFNGRTGVYIDDFATATGVGRASDMVFGPDGNLYVSYPDGDLVKRFNGETGAFMDDFVSAGSGGLDGPTGLRFGPDHNLYVCSMWTHQVKRYNGTTGAYIDDFASGGGLGRPSWLFFWTDLYVSSTLTDEIKRYDDETGAFIGNFVSAGSGGLDSPLGFVFEPDGMLYVVSSGTDEVKRYDAETGAFVDDFVSAGAGGLEGPVDLQFVDSHMYLYVTSFQTNEVKRYDGNTGAFLGDFVTACSGNLRHPRGLRIIISTNP